MADITSSMPGAEPRTGLFGAKTPALGADISAGGLSEDINKLAARLKLSEERYGELRKKLLLIEQNLLSHHKKAMSEINVLQSDITEINSKINEIQDRILLVIKELRLTAKREDVDVMKKYVELWNPMRFVTRDQVENIVKDVMDAQDTPKKKPQDIPKDL